jgi:hypothetical protein
VPHLVHGRAHHRQPRMPEDGQAQEAPELEDGVVYLLSGQQLLLQQARTHGREVVVLQPLQGGPLRAG